MANKKTGSKFRYSVTSFTPTMGKNAGKQLYHPTAQLSGTIDLPKLAQHMSEHDSKYNEGDVYAVLVQAVKCIGEAPSLLPQRGGIGRPDGKTPLLIILLRGKRSPSLNN